MKTKPRITILLMLCILTLSCSSDDDNASASDPVNQLPEATQTGENTFGALVNDDPITPKGGGISPNLVAFYQFLDGEYFFNVGILNSNNNTTKALKVYANENSIEENEVYILNKNDTSIGFGGAFSVRDGNESESFHFTDNEFTGELTITHLDEQNRIVSGTFWFDAVNEEGEVVEVREGRFDVTYSQ